MEPKLILSIDNNDSLEQDFKVNNTVLINFARDIKVDEYCFLFENNYYSTLSFTFVSNVAIDCYFVFFTKSGKPKFTGYHTLQNKEISIDIKDYEKFKILIPRNKNLEVCSALTLVSLFAK